MSKLIFSERWTAHWQNICLEKINDSDNSFKIKDLQWLLNKCRYYATHLQTSLTWWSHCNLLSKIMPKYFSWLTSCRLLPFIKIARQEIFCDILGLNHITLDLLILSFIRLEDIQSDSNARSWDNFFFTVSISEPEQIRMVSSANCNNLPNYTTESIALT